MGKFDVVIDLLCGIRFAEPDVEARIREANVVLEAAGKVDKARAKGVMKILADLVGTVVGFNRIERIHHDSPESVLDQIDQLCALIEAIPEEE